MNPAPLRPPAAGPGLWPYLRRHSRALTKEISAFNAAWAARHLPAGLIGCCVAFWLALGRWWRPARGHADDFVLGLLKVGEGKGRRADAASVSSEAGFLTALARDGRIPRFAPGNPALDSLAAAAAAATPAGMPLLSGTVLVLMTADTDWRRAFDYVDDEARLVLVDLSRDVARADEGRFIWRGRQAFRGHVPYADHEVVRAGVRTTISRLVAALPTALAARVGAARVAFENQLMSEIDRYLMMVEDATQHARQCRPDAILVLEGRQSARFIVEALEAATPRPVRRAAGAVTCAALLDTGTLAQPMMLEAAVSELESQSAAIAAALPRLPMTGRTVVMMSTNARHLPAARVIWERLAREEGVLVVLPVRDVEPRLAGELARTCFQSRGRLRTALLPAYPEIAHLVTRPAYSQAIARAIEAFEAVLPTRRPAVQEGVEAFSTDFLPVALALLTHFEVQMRETPPRGVIVVPGTHPLGMVMAASARANGVPTGQIQTLLTQATGREYQPVAMLLGSIDTRQRTLIRDYFGHPERDIVLTGYVGLPALRDRRPEAPPADAPPTVAFASQPLPGIAEAALRQLIEALESQPHVGIDVYSHPRESHAQMAALENLCLETARRRPIRYRGPGMPWAEVEACTVLAAMYSNLGLQAAAIGKPLIVLAPDGIEYPVDMAAMGIACAADTPEACDALIADFLRDGPQMRALRASREAYFAKNPQLTGEDGLDIFLTRMRASAKPL